MGLHSGFCTVGSFGADNRLEYTIIGGTVNLASRLEGVASIGGILISSSTYAYIKDSIVCEKYKTIKVKGINAQVDTYLVIKSYDEIILLKNKITEEGDGYKIYVNCNQLTAEKKSEIITQLTQTLEKIKSL